MTGALSSETLHATTVAIDGRAVLLSGASGAGKSDLALRLIDRGATLVSDDYTLVERIDVGLRASPPATISGRMEVRGLGIVAMPYVQNAPVALMVDLSAPVDRLPMTPQHRTIAGLDVPLVQLAPLEASAPIKVELALRAIAA
jgi:serine kinase of HPr protein (carbohydrate metabolism regulator)